MRKLRTVADAAVHIVENARELGNDGVDRLALETAGRRRGRCRTLQRIDDGGALLLDLIALRAPGVGDTRQKILECRHAVARRPRKVRAGEKRSAARREE